VVLRGRDGDGNGVQNWKHGWIPLTPRAAMIKAKGNRGLAGRLMRSHGIEDRRKGQRRINGPMTTSNDGARKGTGDDRGKFRYTPGTHTKDYPNRVPGSRYHPAGERSSEGGMTAGEAFKKKAPELREAAAKGDKNAQAELDRRAANRRLTEPRKAAPKVEKPAPAPEAPKAAPAPPSYEPPHTQVTGDTPAQAAEKHGAGSIEHKRAVELEDRAIEKAMRELGIGEKHRVSGQVQRDFRTGGHNVVSYHYDDASSRYRPVGTVRQNSNGTWTAERILYTDKGNERKDRPVLSNAFDSRADAHLSLMAHHELEKHKAEDRKGKAAEKARKLADERATERRAKAAAVVGTPGPNGNKWQVHDIQHDGTERGAKAAAATQQAYKAGWATVVINGDLDEGQTQRLLRDVTAAMDNTAPNLGPKPIKFLVPAENSGQFGPGTGAFVYYGDTTVYVNPLMAKGEMDASYKHSAHQGHFMPAGKEGSTLEYTLTHELGHVHDGQSRFTRPADGSPMVWVGSGKRRSQFGKAALEFSRSHRGEHSKYGNENPAESYAEAFAQWHLGGEGSHRVSDAYAERFGWQRAATNTERVKRTEASVAEKARRANLTPAQQREKDADTRKVVDGEMTGADWDAKWHPNYRAAVADRSDTHQEVQHTKTAARAGHEVKAGDIYEPVKGNGRGSGYATKVAKVEATSGGGHTVTFTDGRQMTLAPGQTLTTARVVRTEQVKRRLSKAQQAAVQYGNGSQQHIQALLEQQRSRRRR
jgi:hypothetical protein